MAEPNPEKADETKQEKTKLPPQPSSFPSSQLTMEQAIKPTEVEPKPEEQPKPKLPPQPSSFPSSQLSQDEIAEKMQLYVHFFVEREKEKAEDKEKKEKEKSLMQTIKLTTLSKNIRVMDLKMQIQKTFEQNFKNSNMKYTPIGVSKTIYSPPLKDTTRLRLYFEDKDEIFVKLEAEAIPVSTEKVAVKDDVLKYKSISDYSFYVASDTIVKVLVPVPGIEKVKNENIIASFTEDSLDVKVNSPDPNGVNYRFAVPALDSKIIPDKSSASVKGDRLVIRLRKAKNEDHWSYLFRQKYVGE